MSKEVNKKKNVNFTGLKEKMISFFRQKWPLFLMNIIIFILAVFVGSLYMYKIGSFWVYFSMILYIVIPTSIMCLLGKVKSKDIVLSIPILYILFLIFLNFCTRHELYGITSGSLDVIPNFVDALDVVFIFTLIEYITAVIVRLLHRKKKNK